MIRDHATILVIDDNPSVRNSFVDYLEDRDYKVLTAVNGLAGLSVYDSQHPDLVLLDLVMPKMNGLDLLREFQARNVDIPLIMISGKGYIKDVLKALHLGAWDYLLKPVEDLSVLEHTIQKSLERAQLRRENKIYQQNLEILVKERTADLEKANTNLYLLNQRLRRIVKSTTILSSLLDTEEFWLRLLLEFSQHMKASSGSLLMVEKNYLWLLQTIDVEQNSADFPLPLNKDSALYRVVESRKPILLDNLEGASKKEMNNLKNCSEGAALIFPIVNEQNLVIAILVLHNSKAFSFNEQDKEIGMILASYSCESLRAIRIFKKLSDSELRFRELADMLPQALCETDLSGKITYANHHAFESFGYTKKDLEMGLIITNMLAPEDVKRAMQSVNQVICEGIAQVSGVEYNALKKNGNVFPVLVYSTPIMRNGVSNGMLVVIIDITYIKKQEKVILHQAHFDSLTNLPNRFLSLDRLNQALLSKKRTRAPLAVLFLDLDDFKKINDTLGHEVGDLLLVQVANRLSSALRATDTIGRLGGDEFIVVLGEIQHGADTQPVAENLLNKMRQPFIVAGHELVLTATIGVALFPEDGETSAELVRSADTAMYSAKADGGNAHCYFTNKMKEDVSRQLLLEQHLRNALLNNELHVHYQPLVTVHDKSIFGFEALIRWCNPELGEISPEEFIPTAERTGLIVAIGEYVLTEALTVLSNLQKRYKKPFKMAVNVSPRQFRNSGFLEQIIMTLERTGVPADALDLEITEGVLMGDFTFIDNNLKALENMGVGIAMDDFGTGYSSLSYLRKYPFKTLKIDQSFVFDIEDDPQVRKLVNAIIAMAHSLNLKVVGEGVETREQLDYLATRKCDLMQGYYFSRPLDVKALFLFIEEIMGHT